MMYTCVRRCLWELEEGIRFPEATAEGWKTKVGSRNRTQFSRPVPHAVYTLRQKSGTQSYNFENRSFRSGDLLLYFGDD